MTAGRKALSCWKPRPKTAVSRRWSVESFIFGVEVPDSLPAVARTSVSIGHSLVAKPWRRWRRAELQIGAIWIDSVGVFGRRELPPPAHKLLSLSG